MKYEDGESDASERAWELMGSVGTTVLMKSEDGIDWFESDRIIKVAPQMSVVVESQNLELVIQQPGQNMMYECILTQKYESIPHSLTGGTSSKRFIK